MTEVISNTPLAVAHHTGRSCQNFQKIYAPEWR